MCAIASHQGAWAEERGGRDKVVGKEGVGQCHATIVRMAWCGTQRALSQRVTRLAVGGILTLTSRVPLGAVGRCPVVLRGVDVQACECHIASMVVVRHSHMDEHGQHSHQHDASGQAMSP